MLKLDGSVGTECHLLFFLKYFSVPLLIIHNETRRTEWNDQDTFYNFIDYNKNVFNRFIYLKI